MEKTAYITKDWPISFIYSRLQPIEGGNIELIFLINLNRLLKDAQILRKTNLIFLNQIINSDMNLLT